MSNTYLNERDNTYMRKSKEILKELPPYVKMFYDAKKGAKKELTRFAYIQDIRDFLVYLADIHDIDSPKDVPYELLDKLVVQDVDDYKYHLYDLYQPSSVKRKLASLSSFYKYLVLAGITRNNPAAVIDWPGEDKSKAIIYLNERQTSALLNGILANDKQLYYLDKNGELSKSGISTADAPKVPKGSTLNKHSRYIVGDISSYTRTRREPVKLRNYLITLLFLKTGIRVSELVSIDLDDIDHENHLINVTGKGGKTRPVSYSEEDSTGVQIIEMFLMDYIRKDRTRFTQKNPGEQALFVSARGKRLTVRQVETMIKEMVQTYLHEEEFLNKDDFSPHKLRSTCATRLLEQTGDIKGVSSLLGHESIEITSRRYAAIEERKNAERMGENNLL